MPRFDSRIRIDASATRVWDVLSDFSRYAEWNPLFPSAEGSLANGSHLKLTLKPPFGRRVELRGRIVRMETERELVLQTRAPVPGLCHCRSEFRIESGTEAVRLYHSEVYGGGLLFFIAGERGMKMREGCFALNLAVKRRAEDRDWKIWPRARG